MQLQARLAVQVIQRLQEGAGGVYVVMLRCCISKDVMAHNGGLVSSNILTLHLMMMRCDIV